MASFFGFLKRVKTVRSHFLGFLLYKTAERSRDQAINPPKCEPATDSAPIKFGILGAANIAPNALILPARCHPEAEIYAVAARSLEKAQAFAAKHEIPKAYGGPNAYQGTSQAIL